ncbi:MAG: hypothetical protein ACYC42_01995 [Lysobacter sp.]
MRVYAGVREGIRRPLHFNRRVERSAIRTATASTVVLAALGPPQIAIQDQHATVSFTAALTGGAGGIVPDAASVHDGETAWRMEGDEWRLISAQWTPRL